MVIPQHLLRWLAPGCLVLLVGGGRAADWNQFRGPTGDGRAGTAALPLEWSETRHVRWKAPLDGKAWASPVVAGGRIWLANATPEGHRLSAVAVDSATGRILDDVTLFEIAEPAFCHPFNSYASPTPLAADGRVVFHFGSAGTACLDAASGELLWTRQDLPCDHYRGPGSSPIPWGDLVIVNFDGADRQYVVALDRATGRTVWKTVSFRQACEFPAAGGSPGAASGLRARRVRRRRSVRQPQGGCRAREAHPATGPAWSG